MSAQSLCPQCLLKLGLSGAIPAFVDPPEPEPAAPASRRSGSRAGVWIALGALTVATVLLFFAYFFFTRLMRPLPASAGTVRFSLAFPDSSTGFGSRRRTPVRRVARRRPDRADGDWRGRSAPVVDPRLGSAIGPRAWRHRRRGVPVLVARQPDDRILRPRHAQEDRREQRIIAGHVVRRAGRPRRDLEHRRRHRLRGWRRWRLEPRSCGGWHSVAHHEDRPVPAREVPSMAGVSARRASLSVFGRRRATGEPRVRWRPGDG